MPATGGNGLAMRAGLMLEGLAQACDVAVLAVPVFGGVAEPDGLTRRLARGVHTLELEADPAPAAVLMQRLATPQGRVRAQALHPLPALCRFATPGAARDVAAHAAGADLVVVLRTYLAPLLDALLDGADRPPVALDVDDVESVTHRRLGFAAEADAFERLEAHYLPQIDRVLTCSALDADELTGRLGLRAVSPIPNAIRLPARATAAPAGRHDLVFVANLSYAPNAEAARWLCDEVLPRLGEVRVAIVGSRPTPAVRALADDPRVTLAPDVADVTPWYEGASVAVVPVLRGGGSRIKLLEALAHRRPVVTTLAGAEGLPWPAAGSPLLLADTPAEFARACRTLLDDPAGAAARAADGEALVRATATVAVVAPQIALLALDMVAR